jgi:hypothetical protein
MDYYSEVGGGGGVIRFWYASRRHTKKEGRKNERPQFRTMGSNNTEFCNNKVLINFYHFLGTGGQLVLTLLLNITYTTPLEIPWRELLDLDNPY